MGFEGERSYLIAMLNPAELRYSGGAALAYAPMTWDEGKLDIGEAFSLTDDLRLRSLNTWPKVKGNAISPTRDDTPLANATFAPSWSVSGEELLRAWRAATGDRYDGVVAVDVVTMARLLGTTGPTTVPGMGELNGDNVTQTVVGNYDNYYPDPTVQDQTFADVVAALQAHARSAEVSTSPRRRPSSRPRTAVTWPSTSGTRKPRPESPARRARWRPHGARRRLPRHVHPEHGGSKVDYYQRRSIDLDVTLDRRRLRDRPAGRAAAQRHTALRRAGRRPP